jgi:antitoxin component YwqK of YwqJK toxin-antitoxin module
MDLVGWKSVAISDGVQGEFAPNGKELVKLGVTWSGKGMVTTYQANGKTMVELGASVENTGGMVTVWNTDLRKCSVLPG